jgi:hypothetical protein
VDIPCPCWLCLGYHGTATCCMLFKSINVCAGKILSGVYGAQQTMLACLGYLVGSLYNVASVFALPARVAPSTRVFTATICVLGSHQIHNRMLQIACCVYMWCALCCGSKFVQALVLLAVWSALTDLVWPDGPPASRACVCRDMCSSAT